MTIFSEKLKTLFLDTLRATCNVTVSAQTVGIGSSTAYKHRKDDIIFADRWDEALQEGIDLLEQKAHERAFNGVDKGIYHQGMMVGTEKQYSDGLTMFLLKAHRPDKYRERSEVKQEVTGGLQLNDTARAARLAALLELAKGRKGGGGDDISDLV